MSTEQSLEEVLMQVKNLRKDLDAVIVIQEGKSHIDNVCMIDTSYGIWDSHYEDIEVIDEPRITEPNLQKQQSATQQLQQFYETNPWYSARYIAGRALRIKDNEPKGRLIKWVEELEKQTKPEIVIQEEEGHIETHGPHGYSGINEDNYAFHDHYVVDKEKIVEKNSPENIGRAKLDLERLALELRKYKSNSPPDEKKEIKKALRTIWYHKHEDAIFKTECAAAIVGLVGTCLAFFGTAGYLLHHFYSK